MAPRRQHLRAYISAVITAGLFVALAGCGVTEGPTKSDVSQGTITVDTEPDNIGGAWQLTGPAGVNITATGDTALTNMPLGEYAIEWQPVADWTTPDPQTGALAEGQKHEFTGDYISSNGPVFGGDSTFDIMTWNLEHFAKNGRVTVDYAIPFIEGLDVDIIALQEISSATYFQELDDGLSGWVSDRASAASYSINLAYLYPVDGPTQVSAVYEILTEYSREFPRRPYVLEGSYLGTDFVVINNHFKCCGDGTIDETSIYDEETRRRDASLLLDDYIRTNFPGKAVIVVGDFNDDLADSPENNVFQNFLDAPGTYLFVDMPIAQNPDGQWSFPNWPSHLDHILITQPLFSAYKGSESRVMVYPLQDHLAGGWNEYDRNLSDHLPVMMKIVLP